MSARSRLRVVLLVDLILTALGAESVAAQGSADRLSDLLGDGTVPAGLGVNVHFTAGHADDLGRIRNAGFRIVRTDLLWDSVERERGIYDWAPFDALVADMRSARLTPLLILAYSNRLYAPRIPSAPDTPSRAYAVPLNGEARSAFMRFARAAAERFGTDVVWEIWNEPDLNFGPPFDLDAYLRFAMETCRQIRGAVPGSVVIGPAASGFAWPLLRHFLAADSAGCFDAVSVHPYRDRAPDDVLSDWFRLTHLACKYRSPCPVLVSSEWGYSAIGGAWSPERQADYVLRLYLLNLLAGVPVSILYDWQDDGLDPREKEANFGLLDYRGAPKPVYRALTELLQSLDGLSLMGRVPTGNVRLFVLAFGRDGIARRLVGWHRDDGDAELRLPERTCIVPVSAFGQSLIISDDCLSSTTTIALPTRLHITSRPAVWDITAPPNAAAGDPVRVPSVPSNARKHRTGDAERRLRYHARSRERV
jgi:hypothetical protein